MLYNKLLKIKHLFSSKVFKYRNLHRLNQHGVEGKHIAQSFLRTLNGENTPDENELFKKLNQFRLDFITDKRKISFEEIGNKSIMTVAEVAGRAASPEIWTHFFYRLSKASNIKNILEIGTNLGISGQYFIKALEGKNNAKFISMEGVKELCEIASTRFDLISDQNHFEVVHGLYDKSLKNIVISNIYFDLVFIDGNHRYEATLKYFELLKNNLSDNAIVVLDDIHWSSGMRRAWREICTQKGIVFSINFFKLGLIMFDSKQYKPTDDHYQLFLSL